MNARFQKLFSELELQRTNLFGQIRSVPAEKLGVRPAGKWSILQIVAHLIAAEQMSLRYLQKKVAALNDVSDSGVWEEMKMMVVVVSQRMPGLRFRAPQMVVDNTPVYGSIAELESEWVKVRNQLKEFLEQIPEHLAKRKIYRHVIAGRLSTAQALIFFREHVTHHHPQILKRLVTKASHTTTKR